MPRLVVPMRVAAPSASRSASSSRCSGRISVAFSAIRSLSGVTLIPCLSSCAISSSSARGSTTTPLPMIESLPSRTTPDGSSESLNTALPITRVCPALWPPWKRTTMSACSDSQSTIFPLPSSPHWDPTTTTFAMRMFPASVRTSETGYGRPGPSSDKGCGGPKQGRRRQAGGRCRRRPAPRSEAERLGLLHLGQRADLGEHLFRQLAVDLDQGDRAAARLVAADMEGGDVDPGIPQRGGELADEAGLVEVGDVDHRGAEFGVHADALDIDDARASVGEHGAGDVARLPLGRHRDGDQALVILRHLARRFL